MAKLMHKSLTDLAREELIRIALSPRSRAQHVESITDNLGCSRTPIMHALCDLESIGLYEGQRWVAVRPMFTGALDIRQRATILCGALETGRKGTTLFTAAAGRWAEFTWEVLRIWPEFMRQWGLSPGADLRRIRHTERQFEAAISEGDLLVARAALMLWADLTTNNPHEAQ